MKITLTTTALVLVFALPLCAMAEELPPQAQRIWAPPGDEIGLTTHATAGLLINDDYGDGAKAAEDWALLGDSFGFGLFSYLRRAESGHLVLLRGFGGDLESDGLAGDVELRAGSPGVYGARLTYGAHDNYSDRDSEMRSPTFPYPPAPPELPTTPHLSWQRGEFTSRYQVSDATQIQGGVSDLRRDGSKASLLRGASGNAAPQEQTIDSQVTEIWIGGTDDRGPLSTELRLSYQTSDEVREYVERHTHDAERKLYQARLAMAYDLTQAFRLHLHGGMTRLESEGDEGWGAGRTAVHDGDTDTQVGQLALTTRVGKATAVNASVRVSAQESDIRLDENESILYAADRTRDRTDARLAVANTALPNTRVRLQYRFSKTVQEDATAQGDRPDWTPDETQTLDQDVMRNDLTLRSRTRLGRHTRLKLGLRYTSVDVEQDQTWTGSGDAWYGVLGDHERTRLAWDAAVQLTPRRDLPVEIGYQGRDQTLERTDAGGVETTWQANRLFANLNWLTSRFLTVYGMVSYGLETYELVGVQDPAAGMAAFNYDGATLRFAPGAALHLMHGLRFEGMYEGIRYENTGHETAQLAAVNADHDRMLLRLRWQATERVAAAVTYRRNEFDENRWDDYIQDLYAVSISGRF